MIEHLRFVGFPWLNLGLAVVFLLLSSASVFGYVNYLSTSGDDPSCSKEMVIDSIRCKNLPDASIAKFARFDHSDYEYDYYYLKLSMLHAGSERSGFYEGARGMDIYITDKRDIPNDSALFTTRIKEKNQFLSRLADLYENAKNGKPFHDSAEQPQNEENSGLLSTVENNRYNPDSPMDVSLFCDGAQVACSNNVYTFPAGTTGQAPPAVNNYPNYGCLGTEPCPAWFYMQVGVAGDIIIFIQQSGGHDVDFICWGPFTSLTDGCGTGLTGTCTKNGSPPPTCCNNNSTGCTAFYPRGNITDCSYSPNSTETCHILNAQVGEIYILLLTNFSQQPGTITFSQTGGTGVTNCNIVVHCSIITMTTNTSACSSLTNTYSVSGNIEFSNPPTTGTLTITDITAAPPVSQTLFPPFVSPLAYTLPNVPCDGLVHTLSAIFSDSTACTLTKIYTAPPPSCPEAQLSGGGEICNDGTSTANVTITFTGTGPFDFTYAINGIPQTPVTGFNGPFPYVMATNIPGTYTLVSLSNAACLGPGTIAGSAVVIVDPLPVPSITGNAVVCSGSASNVYTTEPGKQNYIWTISPGGTPTTGGTVNDNTVTITWDAAGIKTVSVNYTNSYGCHAATPTVYNVLVNPMPQITNAADNTVCSGTTINIVPVSNVAGTAFSWIVSGSSLNVTGFFAGSGNSINDQLVNTGFNIETVTYFVTPVATGCTGSVATFMVTVNPVPDIYFAPDGEAICTQQTTNIHILSHVTGSTFTWIALPSSVNLSGFSPGNGDHIIQTLSNSGSTIETVTYTVSANANGCPSVTFPNVVVTVNPKPIITNSVTTFQICNNTSTDIVLQSSVTGSTFDWTATGSSSNLSGYSVGIGSTIIQTLQNSGFTYETVTYFVTPHANGCTGNLVNFMVTVVPVADVYFNPASEAFCSNHQSNIQILSHVSGSTFSWTCTGSSANVSGFSPGSGNLIQQTLINSGYVIETVTYNVTPVTGGCTGTTNGVIVTVNPLPSVSLITCWDPKTLTTATSFKLKGGIPLGGTYSGAGINSGIFYPFIAGTGTHTINYSYTNNFGCNGSASQTITLLYHPVFTCGTNLTDVRDNKVYPTIQIGSQCWLAANLEYGTMIPASLTQRDNCIPEKYCYNDLLANCALQETYYQWDEVMQFSEVSGTQGLCPPAWHIPTETEWNTLFNNFTSNGFAGSPLKVTGYSGFDALLSGTRHLDRTWDFLGFATFFWSSSEHGNDKAWAHGMNDINPSVSFYPSFRSNAFSIRCLKD